MDRLEYQGKQFFARYGIPVSDGEAVTTVDDAVAVADRIGYHVVVTAHVHVGGRGQAGGVKLASNTDEVPEHDGTSLSLNITHHAVNPTWTEVLSHITADASPTP